MKYTRITFVIVVAAAFQACRTVYAPNAVNSPLLQEKGEIKALVAVNNIQAAYAVTDHVGILANGYFNAFTSDDKQFHNKGRALELGAGYFNSLGNGFGYEAYAGAGRFNVSMDEDNKTKTFQANATKFFVQPAIGWVNPFVEVGLSSRLSSIRYSRPDITGYSAQEQASYHFGNLADAPHWFLEPALTVRGGYKWVKIQLQYGRAFKLSEAPINYDDGIGSVGLVFNIAQWYK